MGTASATKEDSKVPRSGDNLDKLRQKYVVSVAEKMIKIKKLNSEIKEELVSAKDDKLSKMAIRSAARELLLTQEQRDAAQSVDDEKERMIELCKDLPLFKKAAAA